MKTLKSILIIGLLFVCINLTNNSVKDLALNHKIETKSDTIKGKPYKVTATMYFAVESQCDADPLVTAGMYTINPQHASEQKMIAMSRDMIERWGGEFSYGDLVSIQGAGHKDGVYRVTDTMNKRFKNKIDFLETKGTDLYKFDNVTLCKITIQTPKENLLASL